MKIKHTTRVDAGLELMRGLLIDAMDDDKPPASAIVRGWKKSQQADFNKAMEWIEQRTEMRRGNTESCGTATEGTQNADAND